MKMKWKRYIDNFGEQILYYPSIFYIFFKKNTCYCANTKIVFTRINDH